jgi:hypothetical protein
MRRTLQTVARLFWGACLILSSVYCLLAFFPYTYFELIKSPAYAWMPWFAKYQPVLYLIGLIGVFVSEWPKRKFWTDFWVRAGLIAFGTYIAVEPVLVRVANDRSAYVWSLMFLVPLVVSGFWGVGRHWSGEKTDENRTKLLSYWNAMAIGSVAALVAVAGTLLHERHEGVTAALTAKTGELVVWSVISHVLVAVILFSVLNLIFIGSRSTKRPVGVQLMSGGILGFSVLWVMLFRFLSNGFSFGGWAAQGYTATLAFAITVWIGFVVLGVRPPQQITTSQWKYLATAVAMSAFAITLPTLLGGGDWNGVLQGTFTLAFWILLGWCICALRPARASYSVATVLVVVALSAFAYKSLQATEIFWGRPLGSTDDEISRAMEEYAGENASFQLAHHILGNGRSEKCDDFCRILNEYTNIRDAEAKNDFQLVRDLAPTRGERRNIFIFVIDSLRPDYVGAYNPRVDFTPNLDAFAHDSVVVHNTYTQYAGTSLSEPTIWAGAMLPHAHYIKPFSRVNALEKLAHVDGYQMMVSWDEVLSQLLSPSGNLIKLDTDTKLWNQLEVCSTIQQAEQGLSHGVGNNRPLLFYTQPKNVHQFARNHIPPRTEQNWRNRTGFNNRVAYEVHQVDDCLGGFFGYLKAHSLYDDSIIIVTSDHGDALGDFGRLSHSTTIYPEIMRVPLIVHLPKSMGTRFVYDDKHLSALTDITPSLYYLLGHRPIEHGTVTGHPIFVEHEEELAEYQRNELFMASDERAVYGLLTDNGRFLYTTYASPAQSFLFDLANDPNAEHNILTKSEKQTYDEQIINELHTVAEFYGYKPGMGSLLAAKH